MKKTEKLAALLLSTAVLASMGASSMSVFADDNVTVTLDNKVIEFDVPPKVIDGSTMVPLRKIFEEIGAVVKWDDETQTVSARKSSKTVSMIINSQDMQIDKGKVDDEGNPVYETVTLDVPSQIVDGRTLVPARAISEAFGLNVEWDEENKNVVITSDDDTDDTWKENTGTINLTDLTYTGDGIEISGNQIKITAGGDFTLTGTADDANITVNTDEKVKLRLEGASITSSENPCIYFEKAEKAYITITDGTENSLIAQDSESDALYSKENLEIKGGGTLNITSNGGHAVKASDNLTIENGTLNLKSECDGMHINDTFKMTGGTVNISAVGDGIDSESIVIIESGELNIKTNGVPLETNVTQATNNFPMRSMEDNADVEFEKSTKGINAEWMLKISGGSLTVNSASHAIHCQDEIEITGGIFNLNSEYDKGISAHGNLTIDGADTVIDITKSTEGLESKNVLTINDGTINIVASDDAINATGGKSGEMQGGGGKGQNMSLRNGVEMSVADGAVQFEKAEKIEKAEKNPNGTDGDIMISGGNRGNRPMTDKNGGMVAPPDNGERPAPPEGDNMTPPNFDNGGNASWNGGNMKDCLIINGGNIEALGGDDCLDSNGNIVLNGGIIKAVKENGTFSGANSVIDPDGSLTIGENVTIIAAARGGTEGGGRGGNGRTLSIPNNAIYLYSETKYNADETITLKNESGKVIAEYSPKGEFSAVLITSPEIEIGQNYILTVGNDTKNITVSEKDTIIGTQTQSQSFFGGKMLQ